MSLRSIFYSNILSLTLGPDAEFLNPQKCNRSVFCSNEPMLDGLLDGGWSQERPSHDEKLEILSLILSPPGRGKGLETESSTDYAYVIMPP